ncbi:MAG TPA: response regulator [Planctomycetota bacterium]|nr:response regulator [Planctomycetota bacterium]
MRVLIVDDNQVNRRLVREVLNHKGHASEEAETAAEAIAALERRPLPDVVLLDIDLPGGGLTVLAHARASPSPELAKLPVIALTALAMRGDRERLLAAGCDGYISKPIGVRTFLAEIESVVAACRKVRP